MQFAHENSALPWTLFILPCSQTLGTAESPGQLVKQIAGPTPQFDSAGPGWGPRICISNELPGEAATATCLDATPDQNQTGSVVCRAWGSHG